MVNDPDFTYREIMQQPDMWLKEYEALRKERERIGKFISEHLAQGYEIIYTGAGTSAFIGDILEVALAGTRFQGGRSVPTTDLITDPQAYFSESKKLLLISFARSGNSPESLGTIRIANLMCPQIAHIYITCNAEGELARTADSNNTLLVVLPPETNDQSLAMTSSFSTMLFTCMLLARIDEIGGLAGEVAAAAQKGRRVLETYDNEIGNIARKEFSRAVFLGSGKLKGMAEESHLKLQELTDGQVVCHFDSFLGFRHGPKAVINNESILVYLFSEDPLVRRYETDLVKQINRNNNVVAQIAVSDEKVDIPGVKFDLEVVMGKNPEAGMSGFLPCIFTGQLLGYYKSLHLGLDPDSPSVSGNISRVVEGVTIYR